MCRYDKKYARSLSYPDEESAECVTLNIFGNSGMRNGVNNNDTKSNCPDSITQIIVVMIHTGMNNTNDSIIFFDVSTGFGNSPVLTEPDSRVLFMFLSRKIKKSYLINRSNNIPNLELFF